MQTGLKKLQENVETHIQFVELKKEIGMGMGLPNKASGATIGDLVR